MVSKREVSRLVSTEKLTFRRLIYIAGAEQWTVVQSIDQFRQCYKSTGCYPKVFHRMPHACTLFPPWTCFLVPFSTSLFWFPSVLLIAPPQPISLGRRLTLWFVVLILSPLLSPVLSAFLSVKVRLIVDLPFLTGRSMSLRKINVDQCFNEYLGCSPTARREPNEHQIICCFHTRCRFRLCFRYGYRQIESVNWWPS